MRSPATTWGTQYFPLNHMDGIQNLDQTTQLLPFATVKDYENWLARLGKFSTLMDQNIALMRAGIAKKMVQPRAIMERVPPQIATQLVDDPTASPYYAPFKTMPDSIPAAEQTRLRAAASKAISTVIVPAYRRFDEFFRKEYLPASRDTVGVRDLPGGEVWYQRRIRWFTTTDLTADQIHELGLSEVARIRGEMQKVIDKVGFKGDLPAFIQYLRTDPRFRYTDPKQLLQHYLAMSKKIDPLLTQYFGTPAADTLWRAPDPGQHRGGEHDCVLPAALDRRATPRLLLREPVQAGRTPHLRDPRTVGPRSRTRSSPADRARAGAGRPAEVPP